MEVELKSCDRSFARSAMAGCRRGAAAVAFALSLLATAVQAQPATVADAGESMRAAASLAVHWGDFAEAERMFKAMRERQRRTASGQPESTPLRQGFEQGLEPGRGLSVRQAEQTVAMTAQWAHQHARSPLAHVLHMSALSDLAWAYRGSGYANTVPPQAWGQFRSALDRAAQHAAKHADVLLSDSLGYRRVLFLAKALDWDAKRIQAIYEQAVERFPDDDSLHFARLNNLLPKWGGSARQVDQHIEAVVKRTQATRGLALYAQLYTDAAEDQFSQALFSDSMARWERMDQGFVDLTASYPHRQHFNAWAWIACQAQDRKRLLELLDKIGPEPDLNQWGSNAQQTHDTCKAWAQRL